MRFRIILLIIIIVHLAILACLLGPCADSAPKEKKTAQTTPEKSPPELPGKPAEDPEVAPAPRETGGGRQYSSSFFRDLNLAPPSPLVKQAELSKALIVVDWSAKTTLWSHNAETAYPIASLTKMMTVLMLMEALEKDPELTLDTRVRVTAETAKVGGRQVWLDPRETFTLDELLKCSLIFSANDAAFLIGQYLAGGSAEVFVQRMNAHSREKGLSHFTFYNANGLPEGAARKENLGCVRELAYVAGSLLEYPEVLKWTKSRLEYLENRRDGKKTMLTTTNKLLGKVTGVNGMKTGFTNAAGWCMTTTCERDGRVIIVAAIGFPDSKVRNKVVTSMVEWAYTK